MAGRLVAALAAPAGGAAHGGVGRGRAGVDQVEPQAGGRDAAAGVDPHLDAVGVRDDQRVGARALVRRLGGAGVGGVLGRLLRQG